MSALLAVALAASAFAQPVAFTVASSRGERVVAVRGDKGWPAVAPCEFAPVLSIVPAAAVGGAAAVQAAGRQFDFVLDATYFRFGGHVFSLAAPPYVARDTLFLPLQWVVEYLPRLLADRYRYDASRGRLEELPAPPASPEAVPRHVVALDPGHGGPDVGMLGPLGRQPFLREKDVTLAVARDVADELQRRGVTAVLTRTRDTLIALGDRGRIAARDSAIMFVSIHVNAANPRWHEARGARGFETYFLAEARTEDARRVARMENESVRFETDARAPSGDPMRFILNDLAQNEHLRESSRLAEIMERDLGRVHPAEARGVKQAGFAVLATSYMPAVLVEIGYGSNYDEARYLTGTSGQRRIAHGIAEAIVDYLAEYDRRVATGGGGSQ